MKKEILKEYAELKIQEKQIKARIEELNPEIKKGMLDEKLDKLPTSLGNFIIKKIKRWTYTNLVKDLEESLKTMKASQEATGVAKYIEVEQLEFRETKDEQG